MKFKELEQKGKTELEKMAYDLKKKLSDIRFRFSSSKLKNTKEISDTKKEIARILTVLHKK